LQKLAALNLVIIPTYNERENVVLIVRYILTKYEDFHVLIVDDNSPDGTAQLVEELQNEESFSPRLHLLKREKKNGLGQAYIAGFKWALSKEYDFIFEMDADFSHNPKDLKKLLQACKEENIDFSIGSRYVKGVNVVNWPMKRILISWFASKYVRYLMRIPIKDSTAGFICYKKEVLQKINLDKIQFVGYAFQIEMKFKALALGFNYKEVPVIFTERKRGKSKMDGAIIYEAVLGVIYLKLKSIFGRIQ
jgi:dolichol-phosphate mannosyltransferase